VCGSACVRIRPGRACGSGIAAQGGRSARSGAWAWLTRVRRAARFFRAQFHPEIAKFPQFSSFSTNPLEAFYQCPAAGWAQVRRQSP